MAGLASDFGDRRSPGLSMTTIHAGSAPEGLGNFRSICVALLGLVFFEPATSPVKTGAA